MGEWVDEGSIERESPHYLGNGQFGPTRINGHSKALTEIGMNKLPKRVIIHIKSTASQEQLGKLIFLPDSLEDLLRIAGMLALTNQIYSLRSILLVPFAIHLWVPTSMHRQCTYQHTGPTLLSGLAQMIRTAFICAGPRSKSCLPICAQSVTHRIIRSFGEFQYFKETCNNYTSIQI